MQTVHSAAMPIARAGLIADSSFMDVITRLAEEDIPAGVFVWEGAAAEGCRLPDDANSVTGAVGLGFTIYDASKMPGTNSSDFEWDEGDAVAIVHRGRIWALLDANEEPTIGAPVYVRFTGAGAGEGVGYVRTDADTANAAALENCVFRSTFKAVSFQGVTQRIALVEINLPQA